MIIQIAQKNRKQWFDRTYCKTRAIAEKEVEALYRIYKKNEFRIVTGKKKLPGPIYHDKSPELIDRIEKGLDLLRKEPVDDQYAAKTLMAMAGNFTEKNSERIRRNAKRRFRN